MSTPADDSVARLPTSAMALFDGRDLPEKASRTFLLATGDSEGLPHLAMLSVGEVYAPDASHLHLALHATSGSRHALASSRRGLLVVVGAQQSLQVRMETELIDAFASERIDLFRMRVVSVRDEHAPYATITSGITFALKGDPAPTIDRWRQQIDLLRAL